MTYKALLRNGISVAQRVLGPLVFPGDGPIVVMPDPRSAAEFRLRACHFAPALGEGYDVLDRVPKLVLLSHRPVVFLTMPEQRWLAKLPNMFVLDHEQCADDAWNWFGLVMALRPEFFREEVRKAEGRFHKLALHLREGYKKCYIFGTGGSLERAGEHDWSDGIRVVSNTIVKDGSLWRHVDPHVIVAGDALYHFGHTEFAISFRKDLACRMRETQTFFIYPAMFHDLVLRELGEFSDRLIPIPIGDKRSSIQDLISDFELPFMGNVLNLLLLPVACTLSKDVYLWGFDGRAPDDKMFWKNSSKHFYQEHVAKLQAAHPAFFELHVPKSNPEKYVKTVHGDKLEQDLSEAESRGWRFTLLHKSWTETLQRRFRVIDGFLGATK